MTRELQPGDPTPMGVDPNYVAPKKFRIEGLVMGWVDNRDHRDEILEEIKRLWSIEETHEKLAAHYHAIEACPFCFWLYRTRQAIWRALPLWLVTLLLKAQLFLYAVANPRK